LNGELFHLVGLRAGQLLSTHAYLDPGSGSFILQLLLATLLGLGFVLKGYWRKLLSLFKRRSDDDTQETDDE
jgi:hypothetical protein